MNTEVRLPSSRKKLFSSSNSGIKSDLPSEDIKSILKSAILRFSYYKVVI